MKNAKTTTLGIVTILVALGTAVKVYLTAGQLPDIPSLITSVSAGGGLITAQDS